ncbi:flagellar hook assembly protein FlgD [Pseudomonas sp. NPDC090202]|uniref:flagellar hook assembly protein FlgD n=1 Tax=unclassified Pseudomonas TaxID=196821 RepID=UPI003823C5EB
MTNSVSNNASSDYVKSLQQGTSGKTGNSVTGGSALGKDSFLTLLVTQMQNQNPLDPQDNTQFVAQLAQFSSLETMQNLSTSVDAIGGMYQATSAVQAASLVGRTVIVNSDSTNVDTTKTFTGQIDLPTTSTLTTVKIYDSEKHLVRTVELGEQKAGERAFTWDGKNAEGEPVPSGNYTFTATGSLNGKSTKLSTYLPDKVSSVSMGSAGQAMSLNLADGTNVGLGKIKRIEI